MTHVVIIGAGHNGLVAAQELAHGGTTVTVLERTERIGGLCAAIEFADGYTLPGLFHDTAFDPARFGLSVEQTETPTTWVCADGARAFTASLREVEGAEAWGGFIDRVRPFARAVFSAPPPPILPSTTGDFWKLGKTGLGLRRLGRADMTELMRVPPMCAADWVNEHFQDDQALAEWVAWPSVRHSFAGPWSAGTAASLLLDAVLRQPPIRGGGAAIVAALEEGCRSAGVEIRTGSSVASIVVERGACRGVELAGGDVVDADAVLATCDPRTTMLDLVDPVQLPAKIERQFLSIRARGTTAKLALALDGPLEIKGADGEVERAFLGGGSVDGLERAFDAVKYGEFSRRPVLDVWVPTASSPGLAPAGHHVVSVSASFVPYDLRAGWSDETRAELQERILARLSEAAPAVRDQIVGSRLWTPVDLERDFGVSGGCLHHVEHALDQLLFMRPAASAAHYEPPIRGLYLGGAGSHPSGGVTGLPGRLAAATMLRS